MTTVLKQARSVVEFIAGFAILLVGGAVAGFTLFAKSLIKLTHSSSTLSKLPCILDCGSMSEQLAKTKLEA